MALLNIKYDVLKNQCLYSLNYEAPSNCFINDYDNFQNFKIEPECILYIGSVWDDAQWGISNSLGIIALKHPNSKFYFKLIQNESEMSYSAPQILSSKLPLVIFFNKMCLLKLISSGPIQHKILQERIETLINSKG